MKPYGLCADIHLHSWSAFSASTKEGVNTRLEMLLNELRRTAKEIKAAGGDVMVVAGDIFHVRGSVAPLVLNPAMNCFKDIVDSGIKVFLLAGNHDAELKDVTRLSSAITALEGVGATVVNETLAYSADKVTIMMMPWHERLDELKSRIEAISPTARPYIDLILHAPLDGVLAGISAHGLDPEWLASLNFRNVFCGHYHHHKEAAPNVWSIGAMAHHTWSDVGSKAGYLLVDDKVTWRKSHLPEFIDISRDMDKADAELLAEGNYVRCKTGDLTAKEVQAIRDWLGGCGARGVIVQAVKEATKTREASTIKAGESLASSTGAYIDKLDADVDKVALNKLCQDILLEAEAV
jgi:DNA repair exonuclease SbcCD nuclease subunit